MLIKLSKYFLYFYRVFSEEKQLETSHAMKTLIPLTTKHLSSSHINYFLHWSRLLLLENVTTAEAKAFWSEDAVSRYMLFFSSHI